MNQQNQYATSVYQDSAPEIQRQLELLENHGGRLTLPNREYNIASPVTVDASSLCFSGEMWACNTDPNGVFETDHGTKLRMQGRDFAALKIGKKADPISGAVVKNLGIQGDIEGMDTRPFVNFENPTKMSGLCLDSVRTDQCEFSKLSFCGLANAVCIAEQAEVDACLFEKLNVDGCGNGFYFAPRAAYYNRFRCCIVADNPFYGFYACGKGRNMHNLEVQDNIFVRTGGGFSDGDGLVAAALFYDHINASSVDHCLFDDPGTFWYFDKNAGNNDMRTPSYRKTVAIYIIGSENRITDNTILHSSDDSIRVEGDGNVLMNNIADGSVRISGKGNIVVNQVFTSPDARLILEGAACDSTTIVGVPDDRILRVK
ncbi:MAG: hypothetical protein E7331_07870 [Clostridiales bacterium]|nr:hypothetical protein [Clostridiales bacterium]